MAKRKRKTVSRVKQVGRWKRPEWQQTPVPPKLFTAFKKISKADWDDDELYKKYKELADDYLGVFSEEPLEQSRLVVCLTRMRHGSMNLDFSYNLGE